MYLQRNIIDNKKVNILILYGVYTSWITTEPLGFVLPKRVGGFLLGVHPVGNCLILPNNYPHSLSSLLTIYMGKHGKLYSYIFLKQDMANPIAPDNAILFCAGQDILHMYTAARTHTLIRYFSLWPCSLSQYTSFDQNWLQAVSGQTLFSSLNDVVISHHFKVRVLLNLMGKCCTILSKM